MIFLFADILFRLFRSGSKRHGVLLMGLCESGKTQLFSRICYGADVTTVTSMKPSNAEFKVGKVGTNSDSIEM